jgi:hypothetical protein
VNNGDGIPSKVNPDMMLNEKGLRSEWSNHPELYEGDCYKYANITPQEVEAGYRESIGK